MANITSNANPCEAVEATAAEGRSLFDRAANDGLGVSGEEFLARYDRGYYDGTDDPAVAGVVMLIPFAR